MRRAFTLSVLLLATASQACREDVAAPQPRLGPGLIRPSAEGAAAFTSRIAFVNSRFNSEIPDIYAVLSDGSLRPV